MLRGAYIAGTFAGILPVRRRDKTVVDGMYRVGIFVGPAGDPTSEVYELTTGSSRDNVWTGEAGFDGVEACNRLVRGCEVVAKVSIEDGGRFGPSFRLLGIEEQGAGEDAGRPPLAVWGAGADDVATGAEVEHAAQA